MRLRLRLLREVPTRAERREPWVMMVGLVMFEIVLAIDIVLVTRLLFVE